MDWKVGDQFKILPDRSGRNERGGLVGLIATVTAIYGLGRYWVKDSRGESYSWTDTGDMEVIYSTRNECGHLKIPPHLKEYKHQLVNYYAQAYPIVQTMRDGQHKKTCCILEYVDKVIKA